VEASLSLGIPTESFCEKQMFVGIVLVQPIHENVK
jgi:hypothetical protein